MKLLYRLLFSSFFLFNSLFAYTSATSTFNPDTDTIGALYSLGASKTCLNGLDVNTIYSGKNTSTVMVWNGPNSDTMDRCGLGSNISYGYNYYTIHKNTVCADGGVVSGGVCVSAPSPDSDGDGTPDKCDLDYKDYYTMDCDGDGVPNGTDSAPDNPDVSTSCPALKPLFAIINVPHASCTVLAANQGHNGAVDYLKTVEWDSCRNTCTYKWGSCPRGENYQDGVCKKPDFGPDKKCDGSLRCKVEGESGALNVVSGSNSGQYPLMGCYSECTCYEHLNSYIFSVDAVSCNDDDPLADDKSDKDSNYDDYKGNDDSNNSTVDPLRDSNGSVNFNNAESFKAALESYKVAKESTNLKQLDELVKIGKINVDNQNVLKDILKNNKLDSQTLKNLLTSNNNLNSKIDNTNSKINTIASNTASTVSNTASIASNTASTASNTASIASNTAETNNKLDTLIDAVNNLDLNSSASDLNNSYPSYGSQEDELRASLSRLDGLQSDFTNFTDNLKNDLTTVQGSFQNAEDLFKNGDLALNPAETVDSCSVSSELMGKQYELDLCKIVQPFSNVIYTLFYMLGFFGIIITFAYIFIIKGVD